jgi:hypothetical protein
MRSWRNPYSSGLLSFFDDTYPVMDMLVLYYRTSIGSVVLMPGEENLLEPGIADTAESSNLPCNGTSTLFYNFTNRFLAGTFICLHRTLNMPG